MHHFNGQALVVMNGNINRWDRPHLAHTHHTCETWSCDDPSFYRWVSTKINFSNSWTMLHAVVVWWWLKRKGFTFFYFRQRPCFYFPRFLLCPELFLCRSCCRCCVRFPLFVNTNRPTLHCCWTHSPPHPPLTTRTTFFLLLSPT